MATQALYISVDTIALVALVSINEVFSLDKGSLMFIVNVTLEEYFLTRIEATAITFERPPRDGFA